MPHQMHHPRTFLFVRINTFGTIYTTSRTFTSTLTIQCNITRLTAYIVAILNVVWHKGISSVNTYFSNASFCFSASVCFCRSCRPFWLPVT